MKSVITKILDIADRTYYNWKSEGRPIIGLLEKYFTSEDLEEYLASGIIRRLEAEKFKNSEDPILIDHAVYSAKRELIRLFESNWIDAAVWNKPAKDILIEILDRIDKYDKSYTIENAKGRLIDKIEEAEINWLINPLKASRKELLSSFIEKHFSKIEAYAMIRYPEEVFDYIGYFGKSKKPNRRS